MKGFQYKNLAAGLNEYKGWKRYVLKMLKLPQPFSMKEFRKSLKIGKKGEKYERLERFVKMCIEEKLLTPIEKLGDTYYYINDKVFNKLVDICDNPEDFEEEMRRQDFIRVVQKKGQDYIQDILFENPNITEEELLEELNKRLWDKTDELIEKRLQHQKTRTNTIKRYDVVARRKAIKNALDKKIKDGTIAEVLREGEFDELLKGTEYEHYEGYKPRTKDK